MRTLWDIALLLLAARGVVLLQQIRNELRQHGNHFRVSDSLARSISADLAAISTPRVLP
jgi:hypothetical protein